jgi:hypothetical protein
MLVLSGFRAIVILMKTLRALLVLSVILIATGGCATRRMYSGPHQPTKALAQIKPGGHLRIQAVDNEAVPNSSQRGTWLQVLPGEHRVDITSFDYDHRVIKQTGQVDYVGKVLLRPEHAATIKFNAVAGANYEVQYRREKDEATYTMVDKNTGTIVGVVSTTLQAIVVPDYYYGPPVHFYVGPPYWGPPGPVMIGPGPVPPPPPFR